MNYQKFTVDDFVIDPQFRSWVLKKCTPPDFDWEDWLRSNPQKKGEVVKAKKLIEASVNVFEKVSEEKVATEVSKIISLAKQSEGVGSEVKQKSTWKYFAAAASVLLVLGAAWFFTIDSNESKNMDAVSAVLNKATSSHWMVIQNSDAKNKLVVLPDGSSLLLRKGSRVTFPSEFAEKQRNVYLCGEAFFEVVKNTDQPFIIYSNSFTTEVVGTSFMLTDFPESKLNGIVVKTGVVRVSPSAFEEIQDQKKRSLITELHANESWLNGSETMKTNNLPVKVQEEFLVEKIQSNLFKYRNVSLIDILNELEQTYSVKFNYDKSELAELKLSATLGDEPFFRKLDLIMMALDLDYIVSGNEIIITKAN
jgi:ferric-dicitrate binding protein FerR (iron transport regulator)